MNSRTAVASPIFFPWEGICEFSDGRRFFWLSTRHVDDDRFPRMEERRQAVGQAGLQEPRSSERSKRSAASPGCEDGNDGVLLLGHFSRPPFLSFGSVRVGTSCVRRLAVENPNAEAVHGAVYRPPPASKGFTVEQDDFLLQVLFYFFSR